MLDFDHQQALEVLIKAFFQQLSCHETDFLTADSRVDKMRAVHHLSRLQMLPLLLLALCGRVVCGNKPNILFILTDDQDRHMESVQHMKNLRVRVEYEASTFYRHR